MSNKCPKCNLQRGRAAANQAVQHSKQVVFPVQIAEFLLHNAGKRRVLEVLQREDALPSGKKEKKSRSSIWKNTASYLNDRVGHYFVVSLKNGWKRADFIMMMPINRYIPRPMSSCSSAKCPSSERSPPSSLAGWTSGGMDSESCVPGFVCPLQALGTPRSRAPSGRTEPPLKWDDGGPQSRGPGLPGACKRLMNGPSTLSGPAICPRKGRGTRERFISNPRRDSGGRTCTGTKQRRPVVGS